MPRKKSISRSKKTKEIKQFAPEYPSEDKTEADVEAGQRKLFTPRNIILLVLLVGGALLWFNKGLFIAAVVNGQPISRFQLNDQLVRKFGDQTIENLVNERLILGAASQKGIFIQKQEIDNKIATVEKQLEGKMSLSDALAAQGLTQEEFRRQIEIQLSVDKLFEKDATVSAKEIDDYLTKNKQAFATATDQAKLRSDVENILKQQKLNELFEPWFNEIRKNAKIQKFL